TVQELIAAAKAKPGSIDYGSPGNGTPHHLTMELFKQTTNTDIIHIPYTSTGGAVQGIVGGQVKTMFLPIHVAKPLVEGNRLSLLSSGGVKRSAITPDVPALSEALEGEGIDGDIWYGMYAPAGTPKEVVDALNAAVNEVLEQPEVKSAFANQ